MIKWEESKSDKQKQEVTGWNEIIREIQSDKIIQIDQFDRSKDRQARIIKLDTKLRKVLPHRDIKKLNTKL